MGAKMTCRFLLVAVVGFSLGAYAADGAAIYKGKCAGCHGADGSASSPMGKKMGLRDLRSPEVQKQSDASLADIIEKGKGKMPSFGDKLTKDDIAAVVKYVRSLKK